MTDQTLHLFCSRICARRFTFRAGLRELPGADAAAARAQGFPDTFRFYGTVHNKHRQIGNAVPVPLAASLGRCLRAALQAKADRDAAAMLEAQLAA